MEQRIGRWDLTQSSTGNSASIRGLESVEIDHGHLEWPTGEGWPYYHQSETTPPDGPGRKIISGLDSGELYALQINYVTSTGTPVFSARDAYVLPSSDFPGIQNWSELTRSSGITRIESSNTSFARTHLMIRRQHQSTKAISGHHYLRTRSSNGNQPRRLALTNSSR